MDIKNIQSGPFLDPGSSADRAEKAANVANTDSSKQSSVSAEKPSGDRITLSQTEIKTEQAFALNVLDKLNTSSAEKLNNIRSKIADGFYNSDEAVSKISNLISQDLSSVAPSNTSSISEEQKDFLLNDPEVLQTVSERISDELKNL